MSQIQRSCGECSLCCTVLRVDELTKLAGVSCVHQDTHGPGCAIHDQRPAVCRGYSCLWLQGGLEERDRPDRLGAVVDLRTEDMGNRLEIRQGVSDEFDRNQRLREIAETFRSQMPVRISDVVDVMDEDRPYRILFDGGVEHRVAGEWTEIFEAGQAVARKRLPFLERSVRRIRLFFLRRKLLKFTVGGPRSPLSDGERERLQR